MTDRSLVGERYQVGELLGRGGMGTVYLGMDTHTGIPVALKVLEAAMIAQHPEMVERFGREAEALRTLNHPNIVKVLATLSHEDPVSGEISRYIVMEFVPGGSLRDLLDREGALALSTALDIGLDLADALTRAHRLKIIHRDIKPANVLLASDGTPRLTDFGIARLGDSPTGQGPRLTQTGMMLGTIDYLSPEACQGKELDVRADIWAFGVMLFEMLTGQRPFAGSNITATLTAILTQPIPDIVALRPDLPIALIDLIYRMLEKDREQRLPSVRLVGAELEALLAGADTGVAVIQRPTAGLSRFATPTPLPSGIPPHNLPAQTTTFVGRQAELTELSRMLADHDTRLVTILGPGGMGKTRLALEAARAQMAGYEHGVYFVPLAPLDSAEGIVQALAEAVSFQFYEGSDPEVQLLDYLQPKEVLLVIDNFEHVLDGAGLVFKLLGNAPRVKVLATSREKLNLQDETRFRLEGMNFPDWVPDGNDAIPQVVLDYSAVKLFLQGARRARPGFEPEEGDLAAIVRVCRQVGGMPLAILLAAAWVEIFSLEEIAGEIDNSLDFLETDMRDMPARHQSLRAVFNSTWKQLSEAECEIFMKLSVFRGGFSREAAQTIAGASLRSLIALVNKSLLRRDPKSGRYEMHGMLRQYAGEQLEVAGETDRVCDAHCAYYTGFMADRLAPMLGPGQVRALDEIKEEFKNVDQAWRWAIKRRDYSAIGRASESLFVFSDMRSREHEGEELLGLAREKLAPRPGEESHPVWGRVLLPWYDILLQSKGRPEETGEIRAQAESCLKVARQLDDGVWMAHCFILLAHFAEPDKAIEMYEQALTLSPRLDDSFWVRIRQGFCYRQLGQYQKAIATFRQSLERGRENGEKEKIGWSLFNMGQTENLVGAYADAETHWLEAAHLFRHVGTLLGIIWTDTDLGWITFLKGEFGTARSLVEEALDIADKSNRPFYSRKQALVALGYLSLVAGEYRESQRRFEEVLSVAGTSAEASLGLVFVACGLGDYSLARQRIQEALQPPIPYRSPATANLILPAAALVLAHEGDKVKAVELLALAYHHPHTLTGILDKWPLIAGFRAELAAELGRRVFADGWARGQTLQLQSTLDALVESNVLPI